MLTIFSIFYNDFLSENRNLKYIVVLVAFILFLESWKTIIRVFRSTIYKPLLINFLIIVVLMFLFSTTSVFDYKTVDTQLEKTNPYVNLPTSKYISKKQWYYDIKIKIYKKNNVVKYSLFGENYNNIENLIHSLKDWHSKGYSLPIHRQVFFILADKEISMSVVKKVEKALYKASAFRIKYITQHPENRTSARFSYDGIYKILNFNDIDLKAENSNKKTIPLPPPLKIDFKEKIIIKISGNYYFNNEIVKKDELVEFFVKKINDSTVFHYRYDESITYQKYLTLFSAYNQAVDDLRVNDQRIELKMDKKFRYINKEEYEKDQSRLIEKYPLMYFENADYIDTK